MNRNDIQGTAPGYNSRDPLFNLFENGVLNWSLGQGSSLINSSVTNLNSASAGFKISFPQNGSSFTSNERITISVSGFSDQTTQVEYYINNKLIGKSTESPYSFSFIPSSISEIEPENEIKAVATERLGKFIESKSIFTIK